jgi:hypothetical protein
MVRFGFWIAIILWISGCTTNSKPSGDDAEEVMRALAATLTADNKPVCLDGATRGDSLAVFRAMRAAPVPSRRPLVWHQPQPLRPPASPTGRQVFDDELGSNQILISRPEQAGAPLSFLVQRQLNFAANQLSLIKDSSSQSIAPWTGAPLARPRWWVWNRFSSNCSPVYTVTNPVVAKNVAFVSVKAGHWGTTYAFAKQGTSWRTVGQWTNWLY